MTVAVYLASIAAANLAVAAFGQKALVATAFFLIPFDMSARDILHERWKGKGALAVRMSALVACGSVLSFALNTSALMVAVASGVSFAASAVIDTSVFELLRRENRMVRMNASNAASSICDSVLFPAIAFGSVSPVLSASQAALKFFGGALWAYVLSRFFFGGRHADDDKKA